MRLRPKKERLTLPTSPQIMRLPKLAPRLQLRRSEVGRPGTRRRCVPKLSPGRRASDDWEDVIIQEIREIYRPEEHGPG